jgi:hypothetical protein
MGFLAVFRPLREAPGIGPVDEALSYVESIWDIQREHATFFCDQLAGPLCRNEQAPPVTLTWSATRPRVA